MGTAPGRRSRTAAVGGAEGRDHAVALRRQRELDHRVREVDRDLGQADVLDGAGRSVGDEQRLRIGEPDVLAREDDEPAGDETRVLAGFEHAREPVEARVGIGAADRLDERGDDVVVLVVAVANAAQRERSFRVGERDRRAVVLDRERVRDLEHREQMTRVALALVDEMAQRFVVDRRRLRCRGRVRRRSSARSRELLERGVVERLEPERACCARASGPVSEKKGFSVVAPTSTRRPSSTNGSSTSCCAREKRCTSSRKRMVPWPRSPSRARARSATSRTSFTPALTALSVSNAFSLTPATRRAIVVLPVPGGPQMMTDESRSDSMRTRSGLPGPSRCSWPTTSSSVRGRNRAAKRGFPREPLLDRRSKQIRSRTHRQATHAQIHQQLGRQITRHYGTFPCPPALSAGHAAVRSMISRSVRCVSVKTSGSHPAADSRRSDVRCRTTTALGTDMKRKP